MILAPAMLSEANIAHSGAFWGVFTLKMTNYLPCEKLGVAKIHEPITG